MKPSFYPLAFIAVMLLTACNTVADVNPFSKDTIDVGCPTIGILKEAEKLKKFRLGGSKEPSGVVFDARISRVVGKCSVTQSKLTANINSGLEVLADGGPALKEDSAQLEYFVAVTDPDEKIVSRETFAVKLEFGKDSRKARAVDYVSFSIPNATPEVLRGYRIFYGIQMTRDELDRSIDQAGTVNK